VISNDAIAFSFLEKMSQKQILQFHASCPVAEANCKAEHEATPAQL